MNEIIFLLIGFYGGFLKWAPYSGKMFMTDKCCDCNGSGFELKIHNDIADCKSCDGFGRLIKEGLQYKLLSIFLKWTCV